MSHSTNYKVIAFTVALSLMLLGSSFILGGNIGYVEKALSFYSLNDLYSMQSLSQVFGLFFLITGISVGAALFITQLRRPQFALLVVLSGIMLLTLFDAGRWIAAHGGFPVIGSGQGIIKYFALLPLAVYLCFTKRISARQHAILNYIPVAIVLFWIGGMKFLELEAKAIVPLVETSPFMAWLYQIFTIQQASDVIGIYDLGFAILLGAGIWLGRRNQVLIGIAGTGAVFIMTQTFLFTADGGFSPITLIDGLGLFIIKDLWFICNLAIIFEFVRELHASEAEN